MSCSSLIHLNPHFGIGGVHDKVCVAVWREHGEVLRRGGYTRLTFLTRCLALLDLVNAGVPAAVR